MEGSPSLLEVVLLGLGTVFVGLICLIFIAKLMSFLVRSFGGKKQPKTEKTAPVSAAGNNDIPDRGAFVAAISAAIATTMGTDVKGLRILSIEKTK